MKATDAYRKINNSPIKGIVLYFTEQILQMDEVDLGSVISQIQTGKTPPKSNSKYYTFEDVNWFKSSDIGYGKYLIEAKEKFSKIAVTEKKATIYPKDTLLMIGIGGGVGRVSILKEEGSSNQQITGINFIDDINPQYAYYYYLVREDYIKSRAKSMSFPILNQSKINELDFKYPTLAAQNEFVRFIDTCWNSFLINEIPDVAEFEVSLELKEYAIKQFKAIELDNKIQKNIKHELSLISDLKQSILQEAIQGKLTADWREQNPNTESASELLKRIKAEKNQLIKDKKLRKEKALPPISEEEIPFELPDGWVWCRLGEVNNIFLGGAAFSSSRFLKRSSIQVIRISNVKNDQLNIYRSPVFIDHINAKENLRNELFPGDILITMTGTREKRDYCFTVELTDSHFNNKQLFLNQRVGCFRLGEKIDTTFATLALKSQYLLEPVFESSTGSANQANISKNALLNIVFPLPPFEEQKIIVEKVENLMQKHQALEQEIETSEANAQMLMQAVLKEAFEGEREVVEV